MSPRSRATAKKAGTEAETQVTARLAAGLGDDRIERRRLGGANDKGDIAGVRTVLGERVVVEVKNTARIDIGPFLNEAEVERGNDDAHVGLVVAKRVGYGNTRVGEWVCLMTLDNLIRLLGGTPPEEGSDG